MFSKYLKECLLLLLMQIVLGFAEQYVDYCNMNDCGTEHIACNNYGNIGPECPKNVRFVSLFSYKQYILDTFNDLRNEIARGESAFAPAMRMATMQWDGNLADLAMLRAMRCTRNQDHCFGTETYKQPGQAAIWFYFEGIVDVDMIDRAIRKSVRTIKKFQENFSPEFVEAMPTPSTNPLEGHFALAIRDNNAFIGCAASISTTDGNNQLLYVCNYASTNFIGHPVYKTGRTASLCKSGINENYPNLCSTEEVYDFMVQSSYANR